MEKSYNRSIYKYENEEQKKECQKNVKKRYYEKNKNSIKEYNRIYYLKKKKEQEQEQQKQN